MREYRQTENSKIRKGYSANIYFKLKKDEVSSKMRPTNKTITV
jgi:hypothetical protein